jgi:hypothetical protein
MAGQHFLRLVIWAFNCAAQLSLIAIAAFSHGLFFFCRKLVILLMLAASVITILEVASRIKCSRLSFWRGIGVMDGAETTMHPKVLPIDLSFPPQM